MSCSRQTLFRADRQTFSFAVDCRTGEWHTPWIQSLIIALPKKGDLQLCQNYRTSNLISHLSKVMQKFILNRLKSQGKEIIA